MGRLLDSMQQMVRKLSSMVGEVEWGKQCIGFCVRASLVLTAQTA
ncbi:hypothetical protein ACT691_02450 [Vibrio metschnikovii]